MPANTRPAPIASLSSTTAQVSTGVWSRVTLGDRLGRRTAVTLWVAATIASGLYLGWSFIVAAGFASVVLGFLPCAAMCAVGLCAGFGGRKCSSGKNPDGSQR